MGIRRAASEGQELEREASEIRFKHWLADDKALALENQLLMLNAFLQQGATDRAILEETGELPIPPPQPR